MVIYEKTEAFLRRWSRRRRKRKEEEEEEEEEERGGGRRRRRSRRRRRRKEEEEEGGGGGGEEEEEEEDHQIALFMHMFKLFLPQDLHVVLSRERVLKRMLHSVWGCPGMCFCLWMEGHWLKITR